MVIKKIKQGWLASWEILVKETFVDVFEHARSFIGAFVGIGIIAFIQSKLLSNYENALLIGSFGASSVLIYGLFQSPMAKPRNFIGGHVISAFVGVAVYKLGPDIIWLTAPMAVSFSIVFMQITKTLHPPGGASALIAVIGSAKIKALGFLFVLFPVLTGSLILLSVSLILNRITPDRK